MSFEPHDIRVREVIRETPDTITLALDIPAGLADAFAYEPGQYLTIEWPGKDGPLRRAYSLSSAPFEGQWRITVKKHPRGQVSRLLHDEVKAGDVLKVLPPQGRFTVSPDGDKRRCHFFVAAGSGITPVISMMRSLLEQEPQSTCHLLYGSRDEEHIIFRQELDRLASRYAGQLFVTHTLSKVGGGWLGRLTGGGKSGWQGRKGRIDRAAIAEFRDAATCIHKERYWYLCGPSALMDLCDEVLRQSNVPGERIFREHFDSDPLTAAAGGAEAELDAILHGKEVHVHVGAGQTLLQALMAAGHDAPYSCSSGACASCMARVEEGQVLMEHAPALEKSEIEEGWILTCQAKAASESLRIRYPG